MSVPVGKSHDSSKDRSFIKEGALVICLWEEVAEDVDEGAVSLSTYELLGLIVHIDGVAKTVKILAIQARNYDKQRLVVEEGEKILILAENRVLRPAVLPDVQVPQNTWKLVDL